ncbi:MAG: hypothetical protein HOP17_03090 [Acidobacteria bacterium]|nr:hypothetical protein [Acidobacteriota bacterium]
MAFFIALVPDDWFAGVFVEGFDENFAAVAVVRAFQRGGCAEDCGW